MWQLLIGSATELIGGHFKRKSEEKQAQHERKLETIKHEATGTTSKQLTLAILGRMSGLRCCSLYRLSWHSYQRL
jgi:hypothetical protein